MEGAGEDAGFLVRVKLCNDFDLDKGMGGQVNRDLWGGTPSLQ